jgi:DNA-binding MarR family transcriptional regulator
MESEMKERFETFTVLINKISRNIKKIKNRALAELGLRSAHVSCLYYLYLSDGLTATELCERCEEDKATISRALDFLEERGYIEYQSKTQKRYKTPLFLTLQGKDAGKRVVDAVDRVLDEIGVGLTGEERRSFYACLAVISDDLDRITDSF